MGELKIEVRTLDAGHGYLVYVFGIINNQRTELREHYSTEAETAARLATIWQFWAGQVDAEPAA